MNRHIINEDGTVLQEIDPETGEILEGEVLGKIGGKYDNADELAEKRFESLDEKREKKKILRQCIDFMTKRLDVYVASGANLHSIVLQDPFMYTSVIVNDVLERVNVDDELRLEDGAELLKN